MRVSAIRRRKVYLTRLENDLVGAAGCERERNAGEARVEMEPAGERVRGDGERRLSGELSEGQGHHGH